MSKKRIVVSGQRTAGGARAASREAHDGGQVMNTVFERMCCLQAQRSDYPLSATRYPLSWRRP